MASDDVLAELEASGKEVDKDNEIRRIMDVFRLDAYAVLDLQPGVPDSDIKKIYRAKSLLIHPDKTTNPLAPDAFDRLKKAQTVLLEEKERTQLDECIADARMLLIREKKLTKDSDEVKTDEFLKDWREKTKWVIMENETRRVKLQQAQLREEGRQKRKDDEEADQRKRKREHDKAWDDTRDSRIGSWREFAKGGPGGAKKKKTKLKTLG